MPAYRAETSPSARRVGWRGIGWPLLALLAVSLVVFALMTGSFAARTGGVLYPLDDSYIHLALARTLSEAGVWGLLPERPSAASSSPLWTVLLAAVAVVTPGMSRVAFSWVPLLGNLAAAIALLVFWRRRLSATPLPNVATVILMLIVPLPTIAAIGMEHVLHALLATLLAWESACALEQADRPHGRQLARIAILSALAVAARYETLALIATVAALAVWYRRWSLIPAMVVPSALVVAGFGWLWVHNGGWWVPNSFLLKTAAAEEGGFAVNLVNHFFFYVLLSKAGMMIVALIGALALLWFPLRKHPGPERILLILGIACTGAQVVFGQIGWLNRYEAWLVALDAFAALMATALIAKGNRRTFATIAAALFVLCAPRMALSFMNTIQAASDREWEHFGPTEALVPLAGKPVFVNDVGVISYYGVMKPIDVFGLADNESLRLKREGKLDPQGVRAFAERTGARYGQFQICWDQAFNRLPAGWTLVEAWTGPRNVIFKDLTIGYYAEQGAPAKELHAVLARAKLPAGVVRFDQNSALVRMYNANPDRGVASIDLCRSAAVMVTGRPDQNLGAPGEPYPKGVITQGFGPGQSPASAGPGAP